jgi:hypothetical protein
MAPGLEDPHMWRLTAPLLALAVLGAHFFRAGSVALVMACLALMALAAIPRRWAARAIQAGLLLGTLEWLRTLVLLASARLAAGQPATRLIAILATVAVLTALAALVFRHPRLARFYSPKPPEEAPQ